MTSEERPCPHPARNGAHEVYARPNGTSFCRACGEEFGEELKTFDVIRPRPQDKLTMSHAIFRMEMDRARRRGAAEMREAIASKIDADASALAKEGLFSGARSVIDVAVQQYRSLAMAARALPLPGDKEEGGDG